MRTNEKVKQTINRTVYNSLQQAEWLIQSASLPVKQKPHKNKHPSSKPTQIKWTIKII